MPGYWSLGRSGLHWTAYRLSLIHIYPGKVGVSGTLEKDINLKIAFQLKEFLEENDIKVVMTRDSDGGLYDSSASNKKVQDMQRRCSVIDSAKPICTVSIHQNSYHEEGVHGAQAFYYSQDVYKRQVHARDFCTGIRKGLG